MKSVPSDEAKRAFRKLLNDVEHDKEHVMILRYKTPAAVIVPVEWHDQAEEMISKLAAFGDRIDVLLGQMGIFIKRHEDTSIAEMEKGFTAETGESNGTQGQ